MSLKEEIKNLIIEKQKEELRGLQSMLKSYAEAADLDEESTLKPDDYSQQNQNFTSADNLTHRIATAKSALDSFLNLDFSEKDFVEPGALVMTDSINFFIGISTAQFEYDGKMYMGLNTQAPIYSALQNKSKGAEIHFNNRTYKISDIL